MFELNAITGLFPSVRHGVGHVVLLAGEPGIGKTRLAEEAARCTGEAFQVSWGRCSEAEGAPAFWPWTQILRSVIRRVSVGELRRLTGPGAADLSDVLPEVRDLLPEVGAPPAIDPGQTRFRFFDSAVSLLRGVAESQPLLLVLDDLHRADVPSLRLLELVIESVWTMPVLVLGTYRDTETGRAPEFRRVLGDAATHAGVEVFTLRGLAREEAASFVHAALPELPSAAVAADIVERSGGNPFSFWVK